MTKAVLSGWLGLMAAFAVLFAPARGYASSPGLETEPTLDVRIGAGPILAHGASSSTELRVHVAVASGSGAALRSVVASGWVLLHDVSEPGARTVYSTHVTTPVDLRVKARAGRRYQVEFMPDEPASRFTRHTTTTEMPSAKPALVLAVELPVTIAQLVTSCADCPPVESTAGELPHFVDSYDNVAMTLLSPARLDRDNPAECAALTTWVQRGGTLLFVVPASDARREGGAARSLGCGLGTLPRLGEDLVTERRGSGTVAFVRAEVLDVRPKAVRVLASASSLARRTHATPASLTSVRRFGHIAEGPWLFGAASALFAFALVGVPLAARARRAPPLHRRLAWLPAFAALALSLLLTLGAFARPTPGETLLAVHEHTSGVVGGRASVAHGFVRPHGVVRSKPLFMGGTLSEVDDYALADRGHFRVERDGTVLLNEGKGRDFVYYVESSAVDLRGPITISCSKTECTVDNQSGHELLDAELVLPRRGQIALGRVDKRATAPMARLREFRSDEERPDLVQVGVPAVLVAEQRPYRTYARTVRVTCSHDCEAAR